MKTQRLQIQGRVQGVWFRESMRREADRLGVTGWVRNCTDGTVEAVVHGPADAVDSLIVWARSGPPLAHVNDVAVSEAEGVFTAFEMLSE
ncbi:MAG: acylphosphatase [Thiobacillus sp.]